MRWALSLAFVLTGCGPAVPTATSPKGGSPLSGEFHVSAVEADAGTPPLESRTYGPRTQAAALEAVAGDTAIATDAGSALQLSFRVRVTEGGLYAFETLFQNLDDRTNVVTAEVTARLEPGTHTVAFAVPLALLFAKSGPTRRAFLVAGINGAKLPPEEPPGKSSPVSQSLRPLRGEYRTRTYEAPPRSAASEREEELRREAADPNTPTGTFRFRFKNRGDVGRKSGEK